MKIDNFFQYHENKLFSSLIPWTNCVKWKGILFSTAPHTFRGLGDSVYSFLWRWHTTKGKNSCDKKNRENSLLTHIDTCVRHKYGSATLLLWAYQVDGLRVFQLKFHQNRSKNVDLTAFWMVSGKPFFDFRIKYFVHWGKQIKKILQNFAFLKT